VLIPVLLIGRVLYVALVYLCALVIALPPSFMAGLSLLSGWPGTLLMVVTVPFIARAGRGLAHIEVAADRKPE